MLFDYHLMRVVNSVAFTAFTLRFYAMSCHVWMQIFGDKPIQFLTQQNMFAMRWSLLEGLRHAPVQCQKRCVVFRAQSFGCSICTAPQPWSSMIMPVTYTVVVDDVTNCC